MVPVDLNAILLRMERTLALLHELQGGTPEGAAWAWDGLVQDAAWDSSHQGWSCHRAQAYAQAASARLAAMRDVLWDPTSGCWRDYRLDLEQAAGGATLPSLALCGPGRWTKRRRSRRGRCWGR